MDSPLFTEIFRSSSRMSEALSRDSFIGNLYKNVGLPGILRIIEPDNAAEILG